MSETPEKVNFTSRNTYEEYVDEVIGLAKHELRVFEQNLGPGYNASARHEALRTFLLASRRNRPGARAVSGESRLPGVRAAKLITR